MKISICPICEEEFSHDRKQTYCKNLHIKKCEECGKEFVVPYERLWDYNNIVNCGSKECAGKRRSRSMKATVKMLPEGWNITKTVHKKVCKWCGESFETTNASKVYCDRIHYRNCVICGQKFEVPNERLSDTFLVQTCSHECDRKFREARTFEKYGVNHYAQTQEWKDRTAAKQDETNAKRIATNISRFGVPNKSQSSEWKVSMMRDPSKADELAKFTSNPRAFILSLDHKPTPLELCDILGINDSSICDTIRRNNLGDLVEHTRSSMESERLTR